MFFSRQGLTSSLLLNVAVQSVKLLTLTQKITFLVFRNGKSCSLDNFRTFSNFSLETLLQNLVSINCSHIQMSNFRISDQSLINQNCLNSRTSIDVDIKLGQVTKTDMRNWATSKIFDDDFMSINCDTFFISPVYDQFLKTWKPNSEHVVRKLTFSLKVAFCFTKTENRS